MVVQRLLGGRESSDLQRGQHAASFLRYEVRRYFRSPRPTRAVSPDGFRKFLVFHDSAPMSVDHLAVRRADVLEPSRLFEERRFEPERVRGVVHRGNGSPDGRRRGLRVPVHERDDVVVHPYQLGTEVSRNFVAVVLPLLFGGTVLNDHGFRYSRVRSRRERLHDAGLAVRRRIRADENASKVHLCELHSRKGAVHARENPRGGTVRRESLDLRRVLRGFIRLPSEEETSRRVYPNRDSGSREVGGRTVSRVAERRNRDFLGAVSERNPVQTLVETPDLDSERVVLGEIPDVFHERQNDIPRIVHSGFVKVFDDRVSGREHSRRDVHSGQEVFR